MEGYTPKDIAHSATAGVFLKAVSKVIGGNAGGVLSVNTLYGSYEMGIPYHLYVHHIKGWADANIVARIPV